MIYYNEIRWIQLSLEFMENSKNTNKDKLRDYFERKDISLSIINRSPTKTMKDMSVESHQRRNFSSHQGGRSKLKQYSWANVSKIQAVFVLYKAKAKHFLIKFVHF